MLPHHASLWGWSSLSDARIGFVPNILFGIMVKRANPGLYKPKKKVVPGQQRTWLDWDMLFVKQMGSLGLEKKNCRDLGLSDIIGTRFKEKAKIAVINM